MRWTRLDVCMASNGIVTRSLTHISLAAAMMWCEMWEQWISLHRKQIESTELPKIRVERLRHRFSNIFLTTCRISGVLVQPNLQNLILNLIWHRLKYCTFSLHLETHFALRSDVLRYVWLTYFMDLNLMNYLVRVTENSTAVRMKSSWNFLAFCFRVTYLSMIWDLFWHQPLTLSYFSRAPKVGNSARYVSRAFLKTSGFKLSQRCDASFSEPFRGASFVHPRPRP